MLKRGHTLFELLIVFALITLIFSFSAHFVEMTDHSCVVRDLDRLHAAIIYMQRKAMLEHKGCSITFDIPKRRYTADQAYTLSPGVEFGTPDNVLGPPSRPTTKIKEAVTWPRGTIAFYGASAVPTISSGALYLTNSKKTCCYALTCDASEVTHIRRYRYTYTGSRGNWVLLKS